MARTTRGANQSPVSKKKTGKKAGAKKKQERSLQKKKAARKKTRGRRNLPKPRARQTTVTVYIPETLAGTERATRAKSLLAEGKVYPRGCSDFVCDVLQIPYRQAKDIMAGCDVPANSIGNQPNYVNAKPGDVCGWLKADDANTPQDDHVTIWIGEPGMRFIDVQRPGGIPRKLGNGYELNQTLWKSRNV